MNNKHLGMALCASIILNAFLLGLSATHCMKSGPFSGFGPDSGHKFGKDGGMPPPMEDMILKRVQEQSEKISPEGQKKVTAIVDKFAPSIRKDDHDKIHEIFEEIHGVMTAKTFDKVKLKKLHQDINTADLKSKQSVGNMMEAIASDLSDEDRITFFSGMFPDKPPFPPDHEGPPQH